MAAILALGSGCAALAHEVIWTRRLIDLLGAGAESTTRVFGCFFLGLALGAASARWWLRRIERPWRAAAVAEAGVALLALPALFLPEWTDWIWPQLGSDRLLSWQGAFLKLMLSAATVFPPAFCMGLFLPCLARAVLRDKLDLTRHGIWLYAANTLGGFLGIALVSIVTLHTLGAAGSMQVAMSINLLVALGCWLLDRQSSMPAARRKSNPREANPREANPREANPEEANPAASQQAVARAVLWPACGLSFLSGAGILGFEVLALQLISLVAPVSFYAPMAVLAVVVLLLGVGACLLPSLLRRWGDVRRLLWFSLLMTSAVMIATPFFFAFLSRHYTLQPEPTLTQFLLQLMGFALVTLGPAILAAGLIFPAVSAWLGGEGGDPYGRYWGALLATNGLGGLAGTELAYRVIMPLAGVHLGIGVIAVFYALAGLAGTWIWRQRSSAVGRRFTTAAFAVAAVLVTLVPLARLPHTNPTGIAILDEQVGREGTVAVIFSQNLGLRIVMSNQYVLGGTALRYDQARMGHLPMLLHPAPREVACIGLATGITAGAALDHEPLQSLTAIELSPLVVRAADAFFASFNRQVTRAPRAEVVQEDGRVFLAATPARYDVVVGDLFLPWAPGEARLYTEEHFRGVRAALRPQGVFCQWLAVYQLTPELFEMIRNTFCSVFPRVYLFRNTFNSRYPALALVGFREAELDWSLIEQRCADLRSSNQVGDPLMRHVEGVAMLYLGETTMDVAVGEPLNTLSNMRVELAAGRSRLTEEWHQRFVHGEPWLHFAYHYGLRTLPLQELTDRQANGPPGPEARRSQLAWLGQYLTLWELARRNADQLSEADRAQLPSLRFTIQSGFPSALLTDPDGDWTQWPGDVTLIQALREG